MLTNLELVQTTTILDKEIKMYGSIDKPLFYAKDVAEWIEHTNVTMMVNTVDKDEKVVIQLPTKHSLVGLQGNTKHTFLTEDGLYEACMRSRKPVAKKMKKQIKEYLHNIRVTGGTVVNGKEEEFITNYFPSFSEGVKLAMVQDLRTQNQELKKHNEQLQKDNKALAGDILEWKDRQKINAGIRKLAAVSGVPFADMWTKLYKNLQYKFSIDLKSRNNGKKPYIGNVKENEWNKVLKSFSAMCESYGQSPTEMLQQTLSV